MFWYYTNYETVNINSGGVKNFGTAYPGSYEFNSSRCDTFCFNDNFNIDRITMNTNKQFLQNIYDAFNKREIETIIPLLRPDVKWANGLEGGFVHGRDAVREYWTNQFNDIQPELEALKFETDEKGRNVVTVHQIIKDLQGNVLADVEVHQIFTIEDGLISLYEIGETDTIREMIQKTKTADGQ